MGELNCIQTAVIIAHGDPQAGIPETTWTIENMDLYLSENEVEDFRSKLVAAFVCTGAINVSVSFDFEHNEWLEPELVD
jgi:hypothetical protein